MLLGEVDQVAPLQIAVVVVCASSKPDATMMSWSASPADQLRSATLAGHDGVGLSLVTEELWDVAVSGRLVIDNYAGAMMLFDTDLRYRLAGGTNLAVVGWSREQLEGHTIWEAFTAEVAAALEPAYRTVLGGEPVFFDMPFEERVYQVEIVPVRRGGGSPIVAGMVVTRDVTIEREVSRALDEAQETFRIAFANAPIGMAIVELDGRCRRVNDALCDLIGCDAAELEASGLVDFVVGDEARVAAAQLWAVRDDARSNAIEVELRHACGHLVRVAISGSLVRSSSGAPGFFVCQVQDITERTRQEQLLRQQAERDGLTGLWNRHRFDQELARSRTSIGCGELGFVVLLDLDGLKSINDTYGHRAGDDALRCVGQVIAAGVRDGDVACRYGGDEFAVILPNTSVADALQLSERLLGDISRQRLSFGEHQVAISASAGVAEITGGADPIVAADRALYEVKRTRRTT